MSVHFPHFSSQPLSHSKDNEMISKRALNDFMILSLIVIDLIRYRSYNFTLLNRLPKYGGRDHAGNVRCSSVIRYLTGFRPGNISTCPATKFFKSHVHLSLSLSPVFFYQLNQRLFSLKTTGNFLFNVLSHFLLNLHWHLFKFTSKRNTLHICSFIQLNH